MPAQYALAVPPGIYEGAAGNTNATEIQGVYVSPTAPLNGQVLAGAGSPVEWAPTNALPSIADSSMSSQIATQVDTTQVVNVKAFGAVGNGTTNDTAAIQAAITATGTNATLWFPAGYVFVADQLVPLTGQVWDGGGTILRPVASTNPMVSTTASITSFQMRNLVIDGNVSNANAQSTGLISLLQPVLCSFINCSFQNAVPAASVMMQLRGAVECKVVDCHFANSGYHLLLGQFITDTTFQTLRNTITRNTFDATTGHDAVFLTENFGTLGGTVTGNVISTTVSDNQFYGADDQCVEVGSGTVRTTVTNNKMWCTAASGGGVYLRDTVDVVVEANEIYGGTKSGTWGVRSNNLNGVTTGVRVSNNRIIGCYGGISLIQTGTLNVAISDNDIESTTGSNGMFLSYIQGLIVSGNSVYKAFAPGIVIGDFGTTGSGVIDAVITGNHIYDTQNNSGAHALVFEEASTNVRVSHNRINDDQATQTQSYAVTIQNDTTVSNIIIEDNDFTAWGTGSSPINFVGGTATSVICRNNKGLNPVGASVPGTAFVLPATTVVWTNQTGVDATLYVSALGAVTAVHVNGASVPIATFVLGAAYRVVAGGTFQLTYSAAPTLTFVGD